MTPFAIHMQALAQEFIGTVLFVDDQLGNTQLVINKDELNVSIETRQNNDPLEQAISEAVEMQAPDEADSAKVKEKSADDSHILKIQRLSLAFSANDILCSPIYTKPISTEDEQAVFVNKICRLANKADVIVLDWQMESEVGSLEMGTTAQQIISLYKSENPDRDILVCIFTAESDDKVNIGQLSRDNVNVFYASKKETASYEELPKKIFSEFAKRHEGLLPSAALSAIKVIRDNTHRILSLYSPEHDPAYLSHRCFLERPEDAEIFVTELMATTFEDLMRGNAAITKNLNSEVLKSWIDLKCIDLPEMELDAKKLGKIKLNNENRKQLLEKGIIELLKYNLNPSAATDKNDAIKKWVKDTTTNFAEYFATEESKETAFLKQATFAKLTSNAFADAINNNAANYLSLGSVLKNDTDEYFMCVQPLCDSVRLKSEPVNKFIFIKLIRKEFSQVDDGNKKGFNVVVSEGKSKNVFLKVSEEISTLEVFSFSASAGNDKVIVKVGEFIEGKQNESAVTKFTFLAQLKNGQAQRIAMRFLNKVTRIGLDESEWLRRHGTA